MILIGIVVIAGMGAYFFLAIPKSDTDSIINTGNNTDGKPAAAGTGVMVDYRVNSWPENRFVLLVCNDGKVGSSGQISEAVGVSYFYAEEQLSPQEVGDLRAVFESDRFFILNNIYPVSPGSTDGGTAEIIYTRGDQTKKITDRGSAPLSNVKNKMLAILRALQEKEQGGGERNLPDDFCDVR